MDYLFSKQDLSFYSQSDLQVLIDYHKIPDATHDDQLWLLAIDIINSITSDRAEMPPAKAWDRYKSKLVVRLANDRSFTDEVPTELPKQFIDADPTQSNKYLGWMVKNYIDENIKLFKDLGETKTALADYIYLIQKKLITDAWFLNIDAFCGITGCSGPKGDKLGLVEFLDRYPDELQKRHKVEQSKVTEKDIERIYDGKDLLVISPKTREASCKYGAGTKWCTSARDNNLFKLYAKHGPLYILIPKNPRYSGEKYHVSIETNSYKDEKDGSIELGDLHERFPELENILKFSVVVFADAIKRKDDEMIARLIKEPRIQKLTTLDLSKKHLKSLPESIGELKSLQDLNLAGNHLGSLPDVIGKLSSLKTLNLSDNQLSNLPDAIGNLSSLQKLDLDENQLGSLPDAIGDLNSLQELYLDSNQLNNLPDAIGNLSSLKKLYLNQNRLSSLPDAIGNLSSLRRLYLNQNRLSSLPDAIGNLSSLQRLDLDDNQLGSLPDTIGKLRSLQKLYLFKNPIICFPKSLDRKGLHIFRPSSMKNEITFC